MKLVQIKIHEGLRRIAFLCMLVGALIVVTSGVALAYPTDLDISFSSDGKVVTDFAPKIDPRDDGAADVVLQPDGKIVAAGYAQTGPYTDFAIARYEANGDLDTSFGRGGKVTTDIASEKDKANAVALQEDGKIVVAGYARVGSDGGEFAVARYNPDGSLDQTFDGDGKATFGFQSSYGSTGDDEANDVEILPDGKILLVGRGLYSSVALVQLNQDGSLDTSFDGDGKAIAESGNNYQGAAAAEVQPDGRILAVGSEYVGDQMDVALFRFNPDGSPDTSFDNDGKLVSYVTSRWDEAHALALQEDGKIVVGGSVNGYFALLRYNADGTWDSTFGTSGRIIHSYRNNTSEISNIVIQPDGKILAQSRYSFGLARYQADGTPDKAFAPDGTSNYPWGHSVYPTGQGLALQKDGKIIQVGWVSRNGFHDFAIVRQLGGSDTTPPQTTILKRPKAYTTDTTPNFWFESSEARSSFECSIDGGEYKRCSGFRVPDEGAHTLRVRASDALGNTDRTPALDRWFTDRTRPKGQVLINGGARTTTAKKVKLTMKASDPAPRSGISQVRVKNDGRGWSSWRKYTKIRSWTLVGGAGTKTVYVQYRDRAGNVSVVVTDRISYRP